MVVAETSKTMVFTIEDEILILKFCDNKRGTEQRSLPKFTEQKLASVIFEQVANEGHSCHEHSHIRKFIFSRTYFKC